MPSPGEFRWPDDPVAVFAKAAWDSAGFRPHGHIILAGLRGLGYTGPSGLCWKCEGKAYIAHGVVGGVFLPSTLCEDCAGTGIEALAAEPSDG